MIYNKLVKKANLALVLMGEGEENRPVEVKFVGANKERGIAVVTYELNSEDTAGWIKKKQSCQTFYQTWGQQ